MTARRVVQAVDIACIVVWCVGTAVVVVSGVRAEVHELRHPAVTGSAALTVAWMLLGWALMLVPRIQPLARLVWTLGALALLVHLVLGFGVGHGWSHAAAVEHVRSVGGSGAGIVVNYVFAVVWLSDVLSWWANPVGRANRPRWAAWAVHGFLLFVVVNATVVFGPPERRLVYAAGLGVVAAAWFRALRSNTREPGA